MRKYMSRSLGLTIFCDKTSDVPSSPSGVDERDVKSRRESKSGKLLEFGWWDGSSNSEEE